MEMKHFSHDHLLKLLEKTGGDYDNMSFGCCDRSYSSADQVYGCEECNYFIHQACSEIPHEIQHFYHPDHLLKLCVLPQKEEEVYCVACYNTCNNSFTYGCAECPDFTMDIECALLPNKLENSKNMSIHYRHHGHPLTLHQRTDEEDCCVCGRPCVGSTYRCGRCDLDFHESCTKFDIPLEIHHYFHPHPLGLVPNESRGRFQCKACQRYLQKFVVFQCLDCKFIMHIACALLPDKLKQEGCVDHIEDFSHGHPLLLCDSEEHLCKACQQRCAYPTYGCEKCRYFLHESCTGLPQQINHPLHPPHSLTLTFIPKNYVYPYKVRCMGCVTSDDDFLAYKCGECDFLLDVNCGGRNPTITSQEHHHVLTLTTRQLYHSINCVVCRAAIPDGSSFITCKECAYYKLHLLCGPLPCTIKDKCHIDPLKLMDPFVEDYNETDEVYCDTCEQLRDPNEPIYYCKECNFITEIKCVMPEVLRSLEGHNGNVKLRTANKTRIQHIGRVFSARCENIIEEDDIEIETETETQVKDLEEKYFEVKLGLYYNGLKFFTIEESVEILKIFQEVGLFYSRSETISERSILETMGNYFSWHTLRSSIEKQGRLRSSSSYAIGEAQSESDIISLMPSYSNEAFRNLMEKLDSFYGDDPDFIRLLDYEGVIVRIGDLMIMQDLASVLKGLLHAHGDFTTNSTLEPRLKMFFLNLLCNVVRSMCIHYVKEVEEIKLGIWWKSIQTVKHAGFEIQFLIERLSEIALALFGHQVRATFAKTKSQIEESFDEVKELEAKLDAKKRELETLKLDLVLQNKAMEYERTPEMKKCLERESELKWKKAWEDSPAMFRSYGSRDRERRWI